jgi:hypothetical protein
MSFLRSGAYFIKLIPGRETANRIYKEVAEKLNVKSAKTVINSMPCAKNKK